MRLQSILCCLCLCLLLSAGCTPTQSKSVTPTNENGPTIDGNMMNDYLLGKVQQQSDNWKERYEKLETVEQVAEYQKRLRKKFAEAIGAFPERTPLHPEITGVIQRDGYTVEKTLFQSQPNHYVSAVMFVPDPEKFKAPYPAVLVCCGHNSGAKLYDPYQTMGALFALNGIAALVMDPVDQGERGQALEHWPEIYSVYGHTMIGMGSILLGQNTSRFEVWDGMRSIDYLQSRADVIPELIGITGCSGGGTQTSYIMSLDDRIKAGAPSCFITSFDKLLTEMGPQDAEQNTFGQLEFGMVHADYLMMRAPVPVLICSATRDAFSIEGAWESFRYAKRLYTRLGYSEKIGLIENDAEHSYEKLQREGVVRWMTRWLLGKDVPIFEPDIELLSKEEIQCSPEGQVMLIKGARSAYDLNRGTEKSLAKSRKKLWATTKKTEMLKKVRSLAGIGKLKKLPKPDVQKLDTVKRDGYSVSKMILKPEEGIYLPALLFIPNERKVDGAVLYISENGKDADADGAIASLAKAGQVVLAVDIRGTGETQQTNKTWTKLYFGLDGQDVWLAYMLGKSYVGMRAEDILLCGQWLRENETSGKNGISLISVGNVGVPALHAAAVEPDMFESVDVTGSLVSWSNLIELGQSRNQLINTVHAALTTYDLDNLAASIGTKLTIEKPMNALGQPLTK